MVYNFFNKTYSSGAVTLTDKSAVESKIKTNQCPLDLARVAKVSDCMRKLTKELHGLKIKKN